MRCTEGSAVRYQRTETSASGHHLCHASLYTLCTVLHCVQMYSATYLLFLIRSKSSAKRAQCKSKQRISIFHLFQSGYPWHHQNIFITNVSFKFPNQISLSRFYFLKQLFLEYFSKLIIKTFLISLNISTQIHPELHNRSIFISWNNPLGSYCGECLRSCYLNKYFYFFDVFHTSTIDLLVSAGKIDKFQNINWRN